MAFTLTLVESREVVYTGGMRTDKRTTDTPWQAIDNMTDETVGWYDDDNLAYLDNLDRSVSVHYRPSRRKK